MIALAMLLPTFIVSAEPNSGKDPVDPGPGIVTMGVTPAEIDEFALDP